MKNLMNKKEELEGNKWQKLVELSEAVQNDEPKEAEQLLDKISEIKEEIGKIDLQFDYQANDLAKEQELREDTHHL